MTSAAPLMEPAPSAPKSSLEIMLETIRKRDEQRQNDDEPFLPPSPARPRGRGRPPTTPGRRPLPSGFKIGNGSGAGPSTVPVDKRPGVGKGAATISNNGVVHPAAVTPVDNDRSHDTKSTCMRVEGGFTTSNDGTADVTRPAIEIVVDDAMSQHSEDQCMREEGSGMVTDPAPRPHSMVMLIQDGTANHDATATDVVDRAKQQDSESEINAEDEIFGQNVEDEISPHDAITIVPGGGGSTDVRTAKHSASTTSSAAHLRRRAPRQSSPSVSPPWSFSGSSRESSEPEKRTKACAGKLLSGTTSCVRAPVAAVARMALKICGSSSAGARALEEQTDQEAETSHHVDSATVKSPAVLPGGGGGAGSSTVKDSAVASSMSRSGVVWRWLKKISGQLTDARDAEETRKNGLRQQKIRSTPRLQIIPRSR